MSTSNQVFIFPLFGKVEDEQKFMQKKSFNAAYKWNVLISFRHANLILNLFSLMVDANVPDIALEPDKTVKKVSMHLDFKRSDSFQINISIWATAHLPLP